MAKVNVKKRDSDTPAEELPPVKKSSGAVDKPSEEIIRSANGTATVKDERGRLITVKKISSLKRLKLQELIGANAASIPSYVGTATAAVSVIKIDNEDVPWPATKLQFEALVDRLDEEGIAAATVGLADLMGVEVDEEGNITMGGRIISAAKK